MCQIGDIRIICKCNTQIRNCRTNIANHNSHDEKHGHTFHAVCKKQEQPETLDTENDSEQSSGQKPSQEQEQPETLNTENGSEQSSGQKPSEEENAQNDMQSGGNGSTSDSASNNSSSKSNEMDNNNSKDNAQDSGTPAVSAADDVPEQSGGMSM